MSALIGTRIVHLAGNASLGDRTLIAAGDSGLILGLYLAETNGGADDVIFTEGGTTVATLAVVADGMAQIEIPFIVSNGFVVGTAVATSFITVIFRPGA